MRESITSPLRLSEVIVRPGVYTNSKRLNVAGFKIATLDTVPEQYRKVEELNMKGNLLDKLGEIGQFAGLRVLDVSNNKITDQKELLKLTTLRNLQVLHVAGNPFLQTRLTSEVLSVLDRLNVQITLQPSWTADRPDQQQRLQNIMLQNYTELIFLQNLYRKTDLHIQLATKYTLDVQQDPDYRVAMKYKDDILELDQFISQKYIQQLRLDAYALKKTLSLSDVVAAYKDLVDRQKNKKSEMLGLVQKRNSMLGDVLGKKRRAIAGIKSDIVINTALSPKKPSQVPISPLKLTSLKQPHQVDASSRRQTHSRKKSRSPIKQQNYEAHYYKNLTKRNPVYHLLYSPLHSLKPKQKDLLIETLSTHLKQKSIELYRKDDQIRFLEQSHQQKIEQLTEQINIINQQKNHLAKRLLEYQTTVTDFHFDVKNKVRLEKEVNRKQTQLRQAHANSQLYKQMYERVCEGVEYMAQVDRKEVVLREIVENRVKRKYFDQVYYKSMRLKNINILHKYNQENQHHKLLNKSFVLLKRNCMINKIVKLREKEKEEVLVERSFYGLVDYSVTKAKQKTLTKDLKMIKIVGCLKLLNLNAVKRKVYKLKLAKAIRYERSVSCLKVWRAIAGEWIRYNDATLKPMIIKTDHFYQRKLVSRIFLTWTNFFQVRKVINGNREKQAERLHMKRYLRKPFAAWYNVYYHSRSNLLAKQMLIQRMQRIHTTESIIKRFFENSKKNLLKSRSHKKKLINLFETARRHDIYCKIQNKSKQFQLQSRKIYQKGIRFLTNLRQNSKSYLGYKFLKLRVYLRVSRIKTFFSFYPNIKKQRQQHKNSMINLRLNKQLKTLSKIFNTWRYANTRQLLLSERRNMSPLVEDLRSRQQHYIKLNGILREQLAAKDQKLKLYDKKIQNLNFQVVNQDLKYQKLCSTYEESMAEMKVRQLQFMDVIGKLQDKFELVSAEVDQLAKDEIKKQYEAKYSRYSRMTISDLDSTIKIRRGNSLEEE